MKRLKAPLAGALLLAFVVAACGGGGGGGPTQPPPPPPPQPGITFTAAGTAPANSVALGSGAGGTATTLALEVRATQVTNLYGVSFDLQYPATVLRYDGATEGTLLNANGTVQTSLQVVESPAGTLVVGFTRLGTAGGVSGSGTLLTLRFSARAAGTGPFTFVAPAGVDPSGQALAGLTFVAGSAEVRQ
ncbi:MAG TPA: cohesin domain-containing protein [Thermoanaerobaculia bacterium]|nr:cohesin domain-containing protein [Thermoanaerobaculia bacterium]